LSPSHFGYQLFSNHQHVWVVLLLAEFDAHLCYMQSSATRKKHFGKFLFLIRIPR
jgi:hypothetical protein